MLPWIQELFWSSSIQRGSLSQFEQKSSGLQVTLGSLMRVSAWRMGVITGCSLGGFGWQTLSSVHLKQHTNSQSSGWSAWQSRTWLIWTRNTSNRHQTGSSCSRQAFSSGLWCMVNKLLVFLFPPWSWAHRHWWRSDIRPDSWNLTSPTRLQGTTAQLNHWTHGNRIIQRFSYVIKVM